ncbi:MULTISPECIES: hypothetical protein [Bradyrhizobium]|uniref:DUF6894 domain-containing protein n=1 Tax=Bradyrhizobium elkanii TaxID=29448 RepID=A0A4U6S909_BRAEL|nr:MULTISPECIES: hypothetical protein [Bradyrhizobium]MTV15462.1 hypothetical protein [Bradyrhizobium sp. BR2003]TKV81186.1 hypothetical protein FDV58_13760 [Bradyrhizobium elkanii]
MTEVYFHYSNAKGALVDGRAAALKDLADARAYAELVVRSIIMRPGPEDWRSWVLHVSDDLGDEILTLPFASVLGKLH